MKVSLIGAGPGDPGLFTLNGQKALAQADVVVYDALANADLLNFAPKDAERIYVGKVAGRHALPQEEINALLARKASEGKNVARLKGGDPYIFGRGGEEAEYLAARDIPFEEIPGISSAIAAPAYAGIPLTHRDYTSSVIIATGHERPGKAESAHNWRALAQSGATLVFVMGMKNLAAIAERLIAAGLDPATPAAVIHRGCTPWQRVVTAPVANLADTAAKAGLSNPAVAIIGRVVSLREQLDWFSRKPLLGKSIVVTRAREQASEMARTLAELGADVRQCPGLLIQPVADYSALDKAIGQLGEYAWVIFTSVNGVKYFWNRLAEHELDSRALGGAKVAAIGPATAEALRLKGISPDLVPDSYVAESVASAILARGDARGIRILLPRAAKAREVLPETLAAAGALVDVAPAYEATPDSGGNPEIAELLTQGKIDCVTFGSSSTVENFLRMVPAALLQGPNAPALAAIGPITANTLRKHGLEAKIMPEQYTIPALIDAIVGWFAQRDAKKEVRGCP